MKLTYYKQRDQMDCGPTCLRMVGKYYGRNLIILTENPLTAKHRLNNVLMYEVEDKWKLGAEAYYYSKQMLNDGTSGKSYWTEQYKLQSTAVPYDEMHLQQWVEIADVDATPTFFVNGYRLRKTYRVADIRYLITEVPLYYQGTSSSIPLLSEAMVSS